MTRRQKLEERFYRFKELYIQVPESGCWLWEGGWGSKDYGLFTIKRKNVFAHRYSYEIYKGPIPKGMFVCHSCDVPCCVNPDHLWIGTALENNRDIHKKGRFVHWQKEKTHCHRGHLLGGYNLIKKPGGQRECRECRTANHKVWVQKRIEARRLKREQQAEVGE